MSVYFVLEMLGTLAFAISGIRLASAKRFDWFGAYVVGFTTAIGGGTLRESRHFSPSSPSSWPRPQ